MDRLTGDPKGASMFATVAEARIYNRLRQYEDAGLTPEEITRLQKELTAAKEMIGRVCVWLDLYRKDGIDDVIRALSPIVGGGLCTENGGGGDE